MLIVAVMVALGFVAAQWQGTPAIATVEPVLLCLLSSISLGTAVKLFGRRAIFTSLALMLIVFVAIALLPLAANPFMVDYAGISLGYPLVERVPVALLALFPALIWGGVAWSLRLPVGNPWVKAFCGALLTTLFGLALVQDAAGVLPSLPGIAYLFAVTFCATVATFAGCNLAVLYRRREEVHLLTSAFCLTCYVVGGLLMQGLWLGVLLTLITGTILFEATRSLRRV